MFTFLSVCVNVLKAEGLSRRVSPTRAGEASQTDGFDSDKHLRQQRTARTSPRTQLPPRREDRLACETR